MLREIIEERKVRAVETLSDGYAKNKLPLEEYERLVEYINKIESERELAVVEKIVAEYDPGRGAAEAESGANPADDYSTEDYRQDWNTADNSSWGSGRPGLSVNPVIFSTRTYSGPIKSGTQFVSIFGSQRIIVRKSSLGGQRTVLDIACLLGETTVLVEPGIQVSNRAIPILGSCEVNNNVNKMAKRGEPELLISGAVLLGSVTIKLLKE